MHRERNKDHISISKRNKNCYKKVNFRERRDREWGSRMRKHRQRDSKQVQLSTSNNWLLNWYKAAAGREISQNILLVH